MIELQGEKTILVVDDDKDVLNTITKHLEHMNYKVITAEDGLEGLKLIDNEDFDLVITDIVMPFVSGVGLVTALKQKRPEIPVIAITGYGKEPEAAALEKNADLVLSKPVKMAVLKSHVKDLIEKSQKNE